jgi:hypothetical protein
MLTIRLGGTVAIVLPDDCSGSGRRCSALLCVVIADHTPDRIHEYRVAFDIGPFPESIETPILRPQRWIGVPPLSKYYCRTIDHCAFSRNTTIKLYARRGMA